MWSTTVHRDQGPTAIHLMSIYRMERSSSFPVLSPKLSRGTPAVSNMVKYRFAIGVSFSAAYRM